MCHRLTRQKRIQIPSTRLCRSGVESSIALNLRGLSLHRQPIGVDQLPGRRRSCGSATGRPVTRVGVPRPPPWPRGNPSGSSPQPAAAWGSERTDICRGVYRNNVKSSNAVILFVLTAAGRLRRAIDAAAPEGRDRRGECWRAHINSEATAITLPFPLFFYLQTGVQVLFVQRRSSLPSRYCSMYEPVLIYVLTCRPTTLCLDDMYTYSESYGLGDTITLTELNRVQCKLHISSIATQRMNISQRWGWDAGPW